MTTCPICHGHKQRMVAVIGLPQMAAPVVVGCSCCNGTGEASEDQVRAYKASRTAAPPLASPVSRGFRLKLIIDNDLAPGERLFDLPQRDDHDDPPAAA